jgi:hypothetical protein
MVTEDGGLKVSAAGPAGSLAATSVERTAKAKSSVMQRSVAGVRASLTGSPVSGGADGIAEVAEGLIERDLRLVELVKEYRPRIHP